MLPWSERRRTRCSGCDYLGYRWSRHETEESETAPAQGESPDARYCWPTADQQGHLSRIAGLTEGAAGKLRQDQVADIAAVSTLRPTSGAFDRHQALRAKRTVLRERAVILNTKGAATIPDRAGTSATLPSYSDIRVAVSVDFDIGSGVTFALGYRIEYFVPTGLAPVVPGGPRYTRQFAQPLDRPLLVPRRTVESEGQNLQIWLRHLVTDIGRARTELVTAYRRFGGTQTDVSVQFFLWDRLTFDHLCRIFGRHLDTLHAPVPMNGVDVSPMSWIFPAESLLEEADFVGKSSPITIVSDAVNSLMAAPVPHHYGVIDLANSLEPASRAKTGGGTWNFHVNKFYRDPLSDVIPSERGHEVWNETSPFENRDYQWHQEQMRKVVIQKLRATLYVAEKMTRQLRDSLTAESPLVGAVLRPAQRLTGVGDDGQILYQHTRLMEAAEQIEIDLLMAMPPHEREARFHSVRVEALLTGATRDQALRTLGKNGPDLWVFRMSFRSKEGRIKEGEFTWSFLPEQELAAVQDLTVAQFKNQRPALLAISPIQQWEYQKRLRDALSVTIVGLDRGQQLIALRPSDLLSQCQTLGLLELNFDGQAGRFGILDPIAFNVFPRKLKAALGDATGIRHPPLAQQRPLFPRPGVARVQSGAPRGVRITPAAEMLWNADVLASTPTGRNSDALVADADRIIGGLNARQQQAVRRSVERRLAIWWGPPGTGKSRTAQAYLMALVAEAVLQGRPLSIAIVGFTWVAIDTVAKRLPELLAAQGLSERVLLARLSALGSVNGVEERLHRHVVSMERRHPDRVGLEDRLQQRTGVTIVATTVDQIAKLQESQVCAPLFDVMLIDEASQLDVAHALVGLTKLAANGHVTVIGDDKQMPPIHPIEPPEGLENLLGSVYNFFRHYRGHEIDAVMLNVSYRSNREIIEFVREAGYPDDLAADPLNATLRIQTERPFATQQPADWPALPWSPHLREILDPAHPLVAVIHRDRYSSQRNDEEADLVASVVLTLYRSGLMNIESRNQRPYTGAEFFRYGVGIVTPHRAQQAAVFDRLASQLPDLSEEIYASIDTVERFQGQEKALMIASYGLGDADQIAAEERFLYSLNRFNVAASRAKAKFIAIVSRQLVDHLPRDRRALTESRLLKHFMDGFLVTDREIVVSGLGTCNLKTR